MAIQKFEIGDTIKFTWINSGATMTPSIEVFTGSESLQVNSVAMISSGSGHYFHPFDTTSLPAGHYRGRMLGVFSDTNYNSPFVRSTKIKLVTGEVD